MKTKILALLLWFPLGLIGIHMLYLRRLPRVGIYAVIWAFIILVDASDDDVGLAGVALVAMWIYDLVWILKLPKEGNSEESYPETAADAASADVVAKEDKSEESYPETAAYTANADDATTQPNKKTEATLVARLLRLATAWVLSSAMIGVALWAGLGFDSSAGAARLGMQLEDLIAFIVAMGFFGSVVGPALFQPALGDKRKYWPFFISLCFWGAVLNLGADFLGLQAFFGLEGEDFFAWLFGISVVLSALQFVNLSGRHCVWCGSTSLEFQTGEAGEGFWEWRNKNGSPDKRHKDNRMLYGYTSVWSCKDCSATTQFRHFVSEEPCEDESVWQGILLSGGGGKRSSKNFDKEGLDITTSGSRKRNER
jgi:hypothetical protein